MGREGPFAGDRAPFALRGRHLLCILGFRGLGYDEDFVANMRRIIGRMRADPGARLVLVDSADVICASCPHNSPDGCAHDDNSWDRVRKRDVVVLDRLNLKPGAEVTVSSVYKRIKDLVASEFMERAVCPECEWHGLGFCAEGLEQLKASDDHRPPQTTCAPAE